MKTCSIPPVALGLWAGLAAGQASAQLPPRSRPAVSPYLNLLRGGSGFAGNYYNLVRPELEFRSNIQQLQTQTTANREAVSALETASGLPTTGHRTGFMTHGRFFQNN